MHHLLACFLSLCLIPAAAFVLQQSPRRVARFENYQEPTLSGFRRNSVLDGAVPSRHSKLRPLAKVALAASDNRRRLTKVSSPEEREEVLKERKEELCQLLSADEDQIEKIVGWQPGVLTPSVIDSIQTKIAMFRKKLGGTKKSAAAMLLSNPRLLTSSAETLEKKIDLLKERLGANKSQLRSILEYETNALTRSVDALETRIADVRESLELSDKELSKLFARNPQLLTRKLDQASFQPRLTFLEDILGLGENDTKRIQHYVKLYPDILDHPKDLVIEARNWLQHRLGLDDARTCQMCRNSPSLLCRNTTGLEENLSWIQEELALDDDEVAKVLSGYPSLLCSSIETKVGPQLRYLKNRFQLTDTELKELVLKYPSVIIYSPDTNIEPKIQFYSNLVGEKNALRYVKNRMALLTNPSLKGRLKPRLAEVKELGLKVRWDEVTVGRLATRPDGTWNRLKLDDNKRGLRRSSN